MPHPFPFVPQKTFGAILKKGDAQLVLWMDDGSVDAAFEGSASAEEIKELEAYADSLAVLKDVLGLSISFGKGVDALQQLGYEDLGARRFDFSSGIFYGYARRLATMGKEAHERREEILARHSKRHPDVGSADWPLWTAATLTMGACCTGARMLGIASVEALLNEILVVKFEDEYDALEKKRTGWPSKAKRLYDLLGQEEPSWLNDLLEENALRKAIAHHKPVYVDDFSPGHSVEASPRTSVDRIDQLLSVVDQAFADIFTCFGLAVPPTHRPGFM